MYVTNAGETVSASALQEFRAGRLSRDDVFRSEFAENVIFYGSDEAGLVIEPEAIQELKSWGVKQHCIMAAKVAIAPHQVAPGPYVFSMGKTWQPWRVYYDHNACFMISFKPSIIDDGR